MWHFGLYLPILLTITIWITALNVQHLDKFQQLQPIEAIRVEHSTKIQKIHRRCCKTFIEAYCHHMDIILERFEWILVAEN